MLFKVEMVVRLPQDMPAQQAAELKLRERELAQELQRRRVWRHLWRIAGQYANISIFDVEDIAQLHDVLTSLPLFPFMEIKVEALCRHPSSIYEDDR